VATPLFVPITPLPSPSKSLILESNSRVRTGKSPYWDPVSDQAKSFIRRLAAVNPLHRPTAQEALRDPWLTSPTTATAFYADLSPTLRQNWNPRVLWLVSELQTGLATLLLGVGWARRVVVDGMIRIRVQASLQCHRRKRGGGRRDYAWFLWTCSLRTVAPLDRGSWKELKWSRL